MMAEQQTKFEAWCVVEILGRVRTAGLCSEQVIAGGSLLRVDVPDLKDQEKFHTIFYGTGAIYSIHITDETTARAVAAAQGARPVYMYEVSQYIDQVQKAAGARQLSFSRNEEDDDEDYASGGYRG
jgi:hypothetical protein